MLKFDGEYIIRYSDNKKIAKLEGEYLIDYSSYKKLLNLNALEGEVH